ncbi:MAG: peptidoglycan DD-metalloendopeptidase family protein [Bacteroidetes bacterium]|nr:peptidoglycan DD-metalloendopeptidase family protein [Bacteroidota bacterium]
MNSRPAPSRLLLSYLIIILLIGLVSVLPAQNQKAKLQERKAKLEQEIHSTNKLLNQTQKSKEANLNQLYLINKKINHRQELIQAIGEEVNGLDGQIGGLNDTIYRLTNTLTSLKNEYARLIYSTFKNRDAYSRLMFIFSSKNFNQAFKRLKYLQQYTEYRKAQAIEIKNTQQLLGKKKVELEDQKTSKLTLKQKQEIEKSQLALEKSQKDKTIQNLSKQEKNLLKKLRDKEAAVNKLQNSIEAIIADEIRKANEEKARKAALIASKKNAEPSKKGNSEKTAATPAGKAPAKPAPAVTYNSMSSNDEEVALSNSFSGNKGRLPWPVEKGSVVATFGEHPHPEFKNIMVKNNGIDIATSAGSRARSVFDGVVTSVMSIANMHYVIIIRHGDYLSVYSNLKEVAVKKGDKVKARQTLGSVFTDPEDNKTTLHFEIWHGTVLQNPASWLGR